MPTLDRLVKRRCWPPFAHTYYSLPHSCLFAFVTAAAGAGATEVGGGNGWLEGQRPAQKSAKSCENLRAFGRCKWGNNCYYAHSQEEADLFNQRGRSQPRKVGGGWV